MLSVSELNLKMAARGSAVAPGLTIASVLSRQPKRNEIIPPVFAEESAY